MLARAAADLAPDGGGGAGRVAALLPRYQLRRLGRLVDVRTHGPGAPSLLHAGPAVLPERARGGPLLDRGAVRTACSGPVMGAVAPAAHGSCGALGDPDACRLAPSGSHGDR